MPEAGGPLVAWSVVARNLPEHAHNVIHTDAGARAAGFPAALVAGVTTYAYLTHPCVAAWGVDWLRAGAGELRLKAPVFAGEGVECVPVELGGVTTIEAVCASQDRNPRATLRLLDAAEAPADRSGAAAEQLPSKGEQLPSKRIALEGQYGSDYGWRAGDELDLYRRHRLVHPAVWPAIANHVFASELVAGPWIHTRSVIHHHAEARGGITVDVHTAVLERFDRGGRRVVAEVLIEHAGEPLATVEHEAIVELEAGAGS